MSKKIKVQLARGFRKNPTESEKIMWNALRDRQFLNLKFRRQYFVDGYLIDFYCSELRLAIEVDGPIHSQKEQIENDQARQDIIEKKNIKFFRIKSREIKLNINQVLKELEVFIKKNLKYFPSPAKYEREKD
ncbi:MAG: endonuclease domain-containing protein [Patescibacteria group bacterium]